MLRILHPGLMSTESPETYQYTVWWRNYILATKAIVTTYKVSTVEKYVVANICDKHVQIIIV